MGASNHLVTNPASRSTPLASDGQPESSQLISGFQLAPVRSTSLRSPVTHAARFSAAICRNQLDSGFQLMKIWPHHQSPSISRMIRMSTRPPASDAGRASDDLHSDRSACTGSS